MGVGTHLHGARERCGTTLRQVSDVTKISVQTLEAIEREDFSRLPGGIITRGYLRAFATAVDENPEEIVREYLAQYPPSTTLEDVCTAPVPEINDARPLREFLLLLGSVVVAYALYAGLEAPAQAPAVAPEYGSETAIGTPTLPEKTTVATHGSVAVAEEGSEGLYLEIQPTGLCWISARADGQLVLHRLVDGGERVTVTAREQVVLRVGEPGKFSYRVNGTDGRPIGEPGKPVTVTITDENYGAYQTGRERSVSDEFTRAATT
jgi:cytoskeletal protein RodZ